MAPGRRKIVTVPDGSLLETTKPARKNHFAPLSDKVREEICEMYLNQHKMKEISSQFGVHKSTITRIVQRFIETDCHRQKKKGGSNGNKKLTAAQEDAVRAFYETQSQTATLAEIRNFCQDSLDVQLSLGTVFYTMKRIKTRIAAEKSEPVRRLPSQDNQADPYEMYYAE